MIRMKGSSFLWHFRLLAVAKKGMKSRWVKNNHRLAWLRKKSIESLMLDRSSANQVNYSVNTEIDKIPYWTTVKTGLFITWVFSDEAEKVKPLQTS
jgi:hypothetical protein